MNIHIGDLVQVIRGAGEWLPQNAIDVVIDVHLVKEGSEGSKFYSVHLSKYKNVSNTPNYRSGWNSTRFKVIKSNFKREDITEARNLLSL